MFKNLHELIMMAKAKKKSSNSKPKKQIDKYHKKIIVGGTFDELMKAAISPVKTTKK